MRLDIVLGINIDTNKWIKKIKSRNNSSLIVVIDFEHVGSSYIKGDVLYLSSKDGILLSRKSKEVYYYKSLYAYPLAGDTMNSLFKE